MSRDVVLSGLGAPCNPHRLTGLNRPSGKSECLFYWPPQGRLLSFANSQVRGRPCFQN